MAGTLSHFLVMKRYLEEKEGKKIEISNKQDVNIATAFLGSTGPDIFYISGKSQKISDFHHYKNPGLFIKNVYYSNPSDELVVSFVKGFLSHMATDLVIHPFVNSLVGKYQEHIIKKIDIPGFDVISRKFNAHNAVEQAQDYYVFTYVFEKNKDDLLHIRNTTRHEVIFTYKIEEKKSEIAKFFRKGIEKTYGLDLSIEQIERGLNSFIDVTLSSINPFNNVSIINIEDHTDIILDDEYKNYKIFLEHKALLDDNEFQDESSTFMKLIDASVDLADNMIKEATSGNWDNITKPWNLDTGLCTEINFNEESQAVEIEFEKYESVYG